MADNWGATALTGTVEGLVTPSGKWADVTLSDTVDIPEGVTRGLYCHDGGNVACVAADDTVRIFLFGAGEIKPLRVKRVNLTNTAATDVVGLY
jgi:hypothetical protein